MEISYNVKRCFLPINLQYLILSRSWNTAQDLIMMNYFYCSAKRACNVKGRYAFIINGASGRSYSFVYRSPTAEKIIPNVNLLNKLMAILERLLKKRRHSMSFTFLSTLKGLGLLWLNATRILINTDPGKGLLADNTKSLPEHKWGYVPFIWLEQATFGAHETSHIWTIVKNISDAMLHYGHKEFTDKLARWYFNRNNFRSNYSRRLNLTFAIKYEYWQFTSYHYRFEYRSRTHTKHYNGVIMNVMASQITGVSIVCSTVDSGVD